MAERDVRDIRLVFAILATHRQRRGYRRVTWREIPQYERAFGPIVLRPGRATRRLSRDDLLHGAARLHGGWFPAAFADNARRAWGVVFPTVPERDAYQPERRLAPAAFGPLAPPLAPAALHVWTTYPPVAVPSVSGVIDRLSDPPRWPDFCTELGRFTPVLSRGLLDQTFEITVIPDLLVLLPTRGYVTVTRLATGDQPDKLRELIERINAGLAGSASPALAIPAGATVHLALELTTHLGHFMGRGRNTLLLYEDDGHGYLRAVGNWDPMRWYVDEPYRLIGREAQRHFWGDGTPAQSTLHQIALG